jgi:hypothetical protein
MNRRLAAVAGLLTHFFGALSPLYADLSTGLIAYYPFEGNANDASGNGNNGIVHGNASWVSAMTTRGLRFDGTSTYVVVTNFTFQPRDRFSVSFWAKPDTDCGTNVLRHFLSKHLNIPNMEFLIRMERDGKYNSAWSIGGNYYDLANPGVNPLVGLVAPNLTNFDFIVNTYDGSTIRFYVNGNLIQQKTASGSIGQTSYPLTIGAYSAAPTNDMFKGVMDNIRLYSRVLTPDEIQQLYVQEGGLDAGLVAYYPFNGNANDASGNGNHGTTNSGVSFSTGVSGYAARFDGMSGSISVPHSSTLDFTTNDFTLSAWVWSDSTGVQQVIHKGGMSGGAEKQFWLRLNDPPAYGLIRFLTGQLSQETWIGSNDRSATDGRWHHIAAMRQGQVLSLFFDGQPLANASGPVRDCSNDQALIIGKQFIQGNFFKGSLDELRIYNRALSAQEVQQLYIADGGLSAGLVAHYPFDGNANDASGNGNNGNPVGPGLTTDRFGSSNGAYAFGNGCRIDCGNGAAFQFHDSDFTLSAWVYKGSGLSDCVILSKEQNGVQPEEFRLGVTTYNAVYFFMADMLIPLTQVGPWI